MSSKHLRVEWKPLVLAVAASVPAVHAEEFFLEEVVVTATKRATTLSDTGMSISALGGESLKEMGAANFKDFIRSIPGVNFAEGSAPGEQTIVIRGVNFPSNRFQQSTVGVYLDEVALTQNGRNPDIDLIDMERVEVLRGPQGTLYGSSSMGGTIRYISNKANTREFIAQVEAGLEDTREGSTGYTTNAVVNLPLIEDKLALRAVGYYKDLDGWVDNIGWAESNGGEDNQIIDASLAEDNVNDEQTAGGRLALRWFASEQLTAELMYLHHDTEVGGRAEVNPFWGDNVQQRRFAEKYADELDTYSLTLTYDLKAGELMWTSSAMERDYQRISDPSRERIGLAWWFGDFSDAYSYGCDCFLDANGNFAGHPQRIRPIHYELETHELRFSSNGEGALQLVAGAYYSEANNDWQQREIYPGTTESVGTLVPFHYPDFYLASGNTYAEAAAGEDYIVDGSGAFGADTDADGIIDAVQYDPRLYAPLPSEIGYLEDRDERIEQFSLYGNLTYSLSDRWDVTVGVRYFDVEIENDILLGGSIAGTDALLAADELLETTDPVRQEELIQSILTDAANNYTSASRRKSQEDGTQILLGTSYNITDAAMVYFTYSEGYRVGGVNRAIPRRDGSVISPDFGSDSLDSFELGWKTYWVDNTVQLNGALYHIEWEDIQIGLTDEVTSFGYVDNAGTAKIDGLELEARWLPAAGLDVTLGATLMDHKIVEGENEGSELPHVSDESFFLSSRYQFGLSEGLDAYVRGDITYTGGYQTDPNPSRPRLDSFETVNLRAGLLGDTWEAALFVKNALDEEAVTAMERPGNSAPLGRETRLKPRTVGLSLRKDF